MQGGSTPAALSLIAGTENCCQVQKFSESPKGGHLNIMEQSFRTAPLPELPPEERTSLQPFVSVFDQTLIARARRAGFRKASNRTLIKLTAMVNSALTKAIGHSIEPVIVFLAFRRCGQMYATAIPESGPLALQRQQLYLVDCAWRLIVELEQFHRVDELLILTRSL